MPPTIKSYEVNVHLPRTWNPKERPDEPFAERPTIHNDREAAERIADEKFKAYSLRGDYVLVSVWATTENAAILVYKLETAEASMPGAVLVTRLRARLRHHRTINRKQYAALATIARAPGQRATYGQIVKAMGRYATNSFNSCVQRGWVLEVGGSVDTKDERGHPLPESVWRLTSLGEDVYADQDPVAPAEQLQLRQVGR